MNMCTDECCGHYNHGVNDTDLEYQQFVSQIFALLYLLADLLEESVEVKIMYP